MLLFRKRGIVFFGGYPFAAREKDGYFQRVAAIDQVFSDMLRVYIDFSPCPGQPYGPWMQRPTSSTLVLNYYGTVRRKLLVMFCVTIFALRYRRVYFHSVFGLCREHSWLLQVPGMIAVIDVHGVVPEEFRYSNDFCSAVIMERLEEFAVRHAKGIVVVTKAMGRYLQGKYRERLRGMLLEYPILPPMPDMPWRQEECARPLVVYAGGVQKWQLTPLMAKIMVEQRDLCRYAIYTPSPEEFAALLPPQFRGCPTFDLDSKNHDDLLEIYPFCHYGFILRDESIVNQVACPTKLVEYLAMGIVPIVNSPSIGDFEEFGMRYITLEDFANGRLPDEKIRRSMAEENLAIYRRIQETSIHGMKTLRDMLFPQDPRR